MLSFPPFLTMNSPNHLIFSHAQIHRDPPMLLPIMRFSILALLASSLPLTLARLRPSEVIDLLDSLRRQSTPLVRTSTLLDLDNLRLLIRLRGPWQDVVTGLAALTLDTKTVERTIKTRHSSSRSERFAGLDATDISDAFHDYVVSQIDLPSQLLEVAALVRNERAVGTALAPVLKDYRDAVDDLTDTLADRVDDAAKDSIKDDGKILDQALKTVGDAYKNVRDGSGISLSLSLGIGRGRFHWEEIVPGKEAGKTETTDTAQTTATAENAAPNAAAAGPVDTTETVAAGPQAEKTEEPVKTENSETVKTDKVARGFFA
ncbi:hypothetical protein QBC44DRAFT_323141 [Cladorrhinum sp. PSN332]|nr:hypothetical protein QBC44DRAFT_323141 [Cladorrhinum sp. PSN332]